MLTLTLFNKEKAITGLMITFQNTSDISQVSYSYTEHTNNIETTIIKEKTISEQLTQVNKTGEILEKSNINYYITLKSTLNLNTNTIKQLEYRYKIKKNSQKVYINNISNKIIYII